MPEDFLSAERKARLLASWETCVRETPYEAHQFGPPSWLVRERQRKGETFLEAARRVRLEYFPDDRPTFRTPSLIRTETHTKTIERTETRTGRPKKWANESERLKAYRKRAKA